MKKNIITILLSLLIFVLTGCMTAKDQTVTAALPLLEEAGSLAEEPAVDAADSKEHQEFFQKVRNYLLTGQKDEPEAAKLKWSESFLTQLKMTNLYEEYLKGGGHSDAVKEFAFYLTEHAPAPDNWQELFAKDLTAIYGYTPSRYEYLEDDLYQVYVVIDGQEVPYVVVSSKTGYFHG